MWINRKSINFLAAILLLQFTIYLTVFFDIPVVRQVICFVYFTFVPGYVFLKILKLDYLRNLETVLFSVGLSVVFLMATGLVINEFASYSGFSQPLSLLPLMLILNALILIGAIVAYARGDDAKLFDFETLKLQPLAILFLALPILSVIGALWVNAFANNLILLFLLILIPILFAVAVISKRLADPKVYPFIVLIIAISLLLHTALISNYIVSFGSDVSLEYFVFKTTQNNAYWNSTNPYFGSNIYGRYNSMLSITVLPTIYSEILNLAPTWVFKIIFPLIFSLVPLGLYYLWKGYCGKKWAFISVFLFMAQQTFYTELLGLNRQMIAELFFVLLLLVILDNRMKTPSKTVFFTLFSFGLVTSHYGLSEIFLFLIFFVFIFLFIVKRSSRKITASMIALFFVIMFSWYIYTSGTAVFDSILEFGNHVYNQLGDFLDPASRGETVLRGLGLESAPTIWNSISRVFAYATEFLIVVGFIGLLTKGSKIDFKSEYFAFSLIALAFLAALILVPGLANTLNMSRFYHILLFILAPLCVLGAETLTTIIFKHRTKLATSVLLLIVLVPYFLFQTGVIYEVTGSEGWSLPLSMHRMDGYMLYRGMGYIPEQNIVGAQWLSEHVDFQHTQIYADTDSREKVLLAYGLILSTIVNRLSNVTTVENGGIVYLGRLNVVDGIISEGTIIWNSSELSFLFEDMDKIYSNGDCEIYKNVASAG